MAKKRKPELPQPPIKVTNKLGFVKDTKRAADLFEAILRGVRMANERKAREQAGEDKPNG